MKLRYLILGAGPAGLTVANRLLQRGEESFLVIEKEGMAGGLCRSVIVDGSPMDIGGGHFLDVTRPHVNEFLFQFMAKEEWELHDRKTTLCINGIEIGQPIESNIWQMCVRDQGEYLKSIAIAGCNVGLPMPERFVDWIYWKLGKRISEDYMIPYNQKVFGDNLNELGTYWLEKLPNIDFEEILLSCLEKKPYGKPPAHSHFYYPKKYGYGELWLRMAEALKDHVIYDASVNRIDFDTHSIKTKDGSEYSAEKIVTTIPWKEYGGLTGMPAELAESVRELKYAAIQTEYHCESIQSDSQWIYYPDLKLPYHRILVRHNFCPRSKGYWTETRSERVETDKPGDGFRYMNQYAYPLNTVRKPMIMKKLLDWCKIRNVYGLGRWGEHCHYNSDVTVELALKMADEI